MMPRLGRRSIPSLIFLVLAAAAPAAGASETFPFGSELMLDSTPMHGSKRVPMIEIEENGAASIDLWCASVQGQATVSDAAITIVPGAAAPAQCEPERQARDADLLAALAQVTGWRRSGEVVELSGPTPLRFRLMTN
jgi:heat shock protein HslJ